MNGFNEGVNGYYDVEDQLSRYFRSQARDYAMDERATKRAIDSRSTFEDRREHIRDVFRSSIGGLPDRMNNPSVETTGRINRDRYTIESVIFESLPDFHVTANCYVPDGEGPHPGILFLCGHLDFPKSDPKNQKACIELALNGFVVLIVNPIGQGERRQYFDTETGHPIFGGGGGTFAHCYAGQKCFYAGLNLARYMTHDNRCALDYLTERPDVDDDRIGVTGTSGGGLQTLYLSLVDGRIDAAAPCCSVRDQYEFLKTGKRMDAEQAIFGTFPRGLTYDDLVTALAPKPICVGAAASDQYFPIESVHDIVKYTRNIYDLYDAEDHVQFTVADTTHCSVYELRNGVFEFLCNHLGDTEYVPCDDPSLLDRSTLNATPDGRVMEAYGDERTIDDLIQDYVAEMYPDAETVPNYNNGSDGVDADNLRRTVVETLDLARDGCGLYPRFIGSSNETGDNGLNVERVWFKTERDPDIVVTGVLVSNSESETDSPAVVLYEDGTEALPERSEDVGSLAREHGTVFVFDPRGIGAVRNRVIPVPPWVDGYYDIYGTEFKLAYDALQMGSSLLGLRVYDVLRAVEFLRSETNSDRVSFVGEEAGAYHALYAAVAIENVERIDLHGLGSSFYERATGRDIEFFPQLTVFGVVGTCDVPHLISALELRDVHIVTTSNAVESTT